MRAVGPILIGLFAVFIVIFVIVLPNVHKANWQKKADELGDVKCDACGYVGRLKVSGMRGDSYLACPVCTSRNFKKV
jgi:hypothetical protein